MKLPTIILIKGSSLTFMGLKLESWELIGIVLEPIIKNMEITHHTNNLPNYFNSVCVPAISIRSYLYRIKLYANSSDSCYILAFIYLDRLLQNDPGFILNNQNIHRLILSAVVLAIKYLDDYYPLSVSLEELNKLETVMLKLLHYNLHIDNKLYFQYNNELEVQRLNIEEMNWNEECVKPIRGVLGSETFCSEMSYEYLTIKE
jgi:hypothetical protein